MKLYLFNADTDLALGCNDENYIAPASIRRFMLDLAVLPMWYAQGTDAAVMAPSAYNQSFMEQMAELFGKKVTLVTPPELSHLAQPEIIPWGWNLSLRKQLLKLGIAENRVPSLSTLAVYRHLSSRAGVGSALARFNRPAYLTEAYRATTLGQCEQLVSEAPAHGLVFKAPWSGSGKGLFWCRQGFTPEARSWCQKVLRGQQLVTAAPIYNKVVDFAMEFEVQAKGRVRFIGYSLFETNERGAYKGNVLRSDAAIQSLLAQYVSPSLLSHAQDTWMSLLAESPYRGFLGVDMLIASDGADGFKLCPCVEINLRLNMGIVAHALCRHLVHPLSNGFFAIRHFKSNKELRTFCAEQTLQAPLRLFHHRLSSGFLPLVPVTPSSENLAYIVVSP